MGFSIKRILGLSLIASLIFSNSTLADVNNEIKRIVQSTKNVVGVTAIHIETNRKITFNGNKPFLMASTVKVPIAITLLHRVDQRKENLHRVLHLRLQDSVPGSGTLFYLLNNQHVTTSMNTLLRLMLTISDNTASDVILRSVNGPAGVRQRLHELGLNHILVDRSIRNFYLDAKGVDPISRPHINKARDWDLAFRHTPTDKKILAWQAMETDNRDTTTPDDMALLLSRLYKRQLISAANTDLLLDIMGKCKTGRERIKGLLPPNAKVANKTGTWAITPTDLLDNAETKKLFRFASDVGIITLPQNRGHIAIAVYTKSTDYSDHNRDRTIALISRAVYNYFLLNSRPIPVKKIKSV